MEEEEKINDGINEVNKLIDLMTLTEATTLNEQLKELEQIEQEKKHRNTPASQQQADAKKSPGSHLASALFGLTSSNTNTSSKSAQLLPESPSLGVVASGFNLNSFADILSNAGNEFEREWESAFSNNTAQNNSQQATSAHEQHSGTSTNATLSPSNEFNFFSEDATASAGNSLFTADFKDLLKGNQELALDLNLINKSSTSVARPNTPTTTKSADPNNANKNAAWFDLFAELDPIKNPDTIGKESDKDERNC